MMEPTSRRVRIHGSLFFNVEKSSTQKSISFCSVWLIRSVCYYLFVGLDESNLNGGRNSILQSNIADFQPDSNDTPVVAEKSKKRRNNNDNSPRNKRIKRTDEGMKVHVEVASNYFEWNIILLYDISSHVC